MESSRRFRKMDLKEGTDILLTFRAPSELHAIVEDVKLRHSEIENLIAQPEKRLRGRRQRAAAGSE